MVTGPSGQSGLPVIVTLSGRGAMCVIIQYLSVGVIPVREKLRRKGKNIVTIGLSYDFCAKSSSLTLLKILAVLVLHLGKIIPNLFTRNTHV